MFSGPQIGDEFDPSNVTRSELATTLLGFATSTALGETQTSALSALTQAQGNTSFINALDQRVSGELASKLDAAALTPYALQTGVTTAITQLALDQAAANLTLQGAQNATSLLQSSLQSSLALKADQSALEAVRLALVEKVSNDHLDTALLPYATSTQVSQSVALAKAEVQALAAASYGTRPEVTQLTIDVSGKTSHSDLINALSNYQSAPQTAAAIASAVSSLEGQVNSALASSHSYRREGRRERADEPTIHTQPTHLADRFEAELGRPRASNARPSDDRFGDQRHYGGDRRSSPDRIRHDGPARPKGLGRERATTPIRFGL